MLQERRKTLVLVLVLTYPFILYGLIRAAPFITHNGLSYFIDNLERDLSRHPFRIFFCEANAKDRADRDCNILLYRGYDL